MINFEERMVAGLRVRIDRTLCVAFEDCIAMARTVFRLDDDGIVTFLDGADGITPQDLMRACEACPVDALSLFTPAGEPLLNA
jgi:ferredoxin